MGVVDQSDSWNICRALQYGEFFPHFQPLVCLATGKLHGFEVLARWDHPDFGMLSPDKFIPMAERDGWIGEVSRQVLQKAFQAIALHEKGLRLAFNISPLQLQDLALPEQIRRLAEDAGFSLEFATAEITESALAEHGVGSDHYRGSEGDGMPDRAGRLRNRILQSLPSEVSALRRTKSRPVIRWFHDNGAREPKDCSRRRRAGTEPWTEYCSRGRRDAGTS